MASSAVALSPDLDAEKLLFRRQFVLGPRHLAALSGWRRAVVGDRFRLTVHPDLKLAQVRRGEVELTLLGYLIDPDFPERDDTGIMEALLVDSGTPAALIQATERLGGRWILIVHQAGGTVLFHDPAGLRQVVYTRDGEGELWCATQPQLLAENLGLEVSAEARVFLGSEYYQRWGMPWWPGDATPYAEVRQLLPNHSLDLHTGQVHRYWPWAPRQRRELREGVERGADLLERLMISAHRRFPLAIGITAGWDSRVVLAASRRVARDILFFTHIHSTQGAQVTSRSADVALPRRLLGRLGLEHRVILCPTLAEYRNADGERVRRFKELFTRNVTCAFEITAPIAYGMLGEYPEERVCVKGNVSEVARCAYYKYDPPVPLDAVGIAQRCGLRDADRVPNPFAVAQVETWLAGARPAAERHGYEVLDLFYWEQRMGRWQAQDQAERDIVQEVFTPFNCRALLATLLGVEMVHRQQRENRLYTELIRHLWPEVLDEPINPPSLRQRLKQRIKKLLMRSRSA